VCSTTTIHKHSSTHGETWRGPAARYKRGKLMVMFRGWPRAEVGTNTSRDTVKNWEVRRKYRGPAQGTLCSRLPRYPLRITESQGSSPCQKTSCLLGMSSFAETLRSHPYRRIRRALPRTGEVSANCKNSCRIQTSNHFNTPPLAVPLAALR
jgi:hypothetical protein